MTITNCVAEMPSIEELLASPATSYWLKNALQSALARDPCDAAADANVLALVLKRNSEQVLDNANIAFGR